MAPAVPRGKYSREPKTVSSGASSITLTMTTACFLVFWHFFRATRKKVLIPTDIPGPSQTPMMVRHCLGLRVEGARLTKTHKGLGFRPREILGQALNALNKAGLRGASLNPKP